MEERTSKPVITLIENGPIKIAGNFTMSDDKNNKIGEGNEVFLCRCGNSSKKPYCDGTHKSAEAKADTKKESCD